MPSIAPNVYVDSKMSAQQRQQFLQTVKEAKIEISRFFGGMQSSPDIYACSTKECFARFGGVSAKAKSIDDKKVLLSLRGLDKTTLIHELAHVELHKRLGKPQLWNKVPMWFDEGLAVLVCKDQRYEKEVALLPLNELTSQEQWIDAVRSNKPAYNIARQAVSVWYEKVGVQGLHALIIDMQQGNDFALVDSLNERWEVTRL